MRRRVPLLVAPVLRSTLHVFLATSLLATIGVLVGPTSAHAASISIKRFTATVSDANKITLDWVVSGGGSSGMLNIYGVGSRPQACPLRQAVGCSTSLRVGSGGNFRYTLAVHNNAMQFATSTVAGVVRPLTPPSTPSPRVDVDVLNIRPQTLSWSHAGTGFVEVILPGSLSPYAKRFPARGTYAVRAASLPIGSSTFHVVYCEQPAARETLFCSSATPVTYVVGPAEFSGPYRKFVPAHKDLRLAWSGSGNLWHLTARTLGVNEWLTKPSFTLPAASITPGVHEISLVSCLSKASTTTCSSRLVVAGAVVTNDVGRAEVVAGGGASVPTWTTTHWDTAFTARTYDASLEPLTGNPLDIAFDSSGGIWQVGEFSRAIAQVGHGHVTDHVSPVGPAARTRSRCSGPMLPPRRACSASV